MSALTDGAAVIVAGNPDAAADKLEKLAAHSFERVRREVARNPNTPGRVLENLIYDVDKFVAEYAANHPSLPYDVALRITDWIDRPELRHSLASNPGLHPDIARILTWDVSELVREVAAANSCVPVSLLSEFADSEDIYTCLGVAKNPNSDFAVLVKLIHHDFTVAFPHAKSRFSSMTDEELAAYFNPARNKIRDLSDRQFQNGLVDAGYSQFVGLPRDWVMRVLCSGVK